MRIKSLILAALCMVTVGVYAQSNYPFNGLDMNMGNLSRLSDAKTRSISPENFTGEKGKGGMADPVRDKDQRNVANAHHAAKDLGKGWKVNPFIIVKPGETITIAEIEGPGAIQQIWMTPTGNWRFSILRMYWDDEKEAYFHAQLRRSNPTQGSLHTLIDGVKGKGQYVGTYLAWRVNDNCWWGEGEIKFYMDGDKEYPTICGPGTEDYICGSYTIEHQKTRQYQEFTTPYAGMHQVIRPDGLYRAVTAFGLYRWHILDPVRFDKDLKVTIQDLGWRHDGRYNNQKSDISSTTFWYQAEPHAKFPALPSKDDLEIPRW